MDGMFAHWKMCLAHRHSAASVTQFVSFLVYHLLHVLPSWTRNIIDCIQSSGHCPLVIVHQRITSLQLVVC